MNIFKPIALKSRKFRIFQFLKTILFDIAVMLMVIVSLGSIITIFIGSLMEGEIGYIIFSMALSVGFGWGTFLSGKILAEHLELSLFINSSSKNAEKKKKTLINSLMKKEQLAFIADISVDIKMSCLDENGILNLYDTINLAQEVLRSSGFNRKISEYFINTVDKKERLNYFQRIYDCGFQSVRYVTSVGYIDLQLEDFPITKSEDPIHRFSSQFLMQHYVSLQYKARFAHLKELCRPENECSAGLSIAAVHTNLAVSIFCNSLFYVFVLPNSNMERDGLNFSETAFEISNRKGFIDAMFFQVKDFSLISVPDTLAVPYLDKNRDQQLFITTYTNYTAAKKQLDELKETLMIWEAETFEDEKIEAVYYWNRLKGVTSCYICVMTGKEIVTHMMGAKCEGIVVNCEYKISNDIFASYITDMAKGP